MAKNCGSTNNYAVCRSCGAWIVLEDEPVQTFESARQTMGNPQFECDACSPTKRVRIGYSPMEG
jgi:hypothetical protein